MVLFKLSADLREHYYLFVSIIMDTVSLILDHTGRLEQMKSLV